MLEPGKKYEKVVEHGIHVSQATLDTAKAGPNDDLVQVSNPTLLKLLVVNILLLWIVLQCR